MQRFLGLLLLVICGASCTKDLTERKQVYYNDFESGNVSNFEISDRSGLVDPKQVTDYNGTKVLGRFHNGKYVQLTVGNLHEHNRLKIEFDLYIHDNWTGNQVPAGHSLPDYWVLAVDQTYPIFTTFSNINGIAQSFPLNYSTGQDPFPAKGNSWKINLPGGCTAQPAGNGTTLYKIDLFHFHTAPLARIAFTDQMRLSLPLCDKSWSIDNIRVTAMLFR